MLYKKAPTKPWILLCDIIHAWRLRKIALKIFNCKILKYLINIKLLIFFKFIFQSLISTHDQVGYITYEKLKNPTTEIDVTDNKAIKTLDSLINGSTMPAETIKMVGIRKNPKEPLGLTVEIDEYNQLVVARILAGGTIDRQGLLNKGDVILAVNSVEVHNPEELQAEILKAHDFVTLKIGPSVEEEMKLGKLVVEGGNGQVKNGKNLDTGKKLAVSF